jgi:hypothetical protein
LAFHSGREANYSPPSSAEVKEWVELYLHSPNTSSWGGAQLGGEQGQLYLHLVSGLCPSCGISNTILPFDTGSVLVIR